ncbi:MAG: NAD(P)/FAD-dependent oxidoreductase [Actinobacteria bacterium]|nr:NAD(P)/FAD-dependent oxidoreductase [Actinomycetota bacterium]
MTSGADIVVAGAGHNSLLTACYLAKAGYRCLVLDARGIPGGGAATEELLLPGFGIDTCATGHTMIRVNPALLRDELGLIAGYGLRYVEPDPVEQVAFPDGEQLTMWLDRERTIEEVARFSREDAAAYRRLLDDYDEVKALFSRWQFTPVGFGPSLDELLAGHPIWARRRQLSAVEVVRHEFSSRHVQAFLLWMAYQVFQPVDTPGSGVLPYQQTFGRQQRSWSIPVGGSASLTAAMTGYLEDHGSTIHCGRRVARLLVEDGRCTGVETEDGEQYRAGTAVVSTIHIKHLRDMAPASAWPEEFHYGVDTYDVGVPGFAAYYCTTAAPEFASPHGPRTAVSAGMAGWPEDMIGMGADLRAGRYLADPPWVLVATPTLADPGRAPEGCHTVKILSPQTYQLPGTMGGWDSVKEAHAARLLERLRRHAPNLTDDTILAQLIKSPADIEQLNPHMINGAFHGGNRGPAFSGALRPVPGWASHRMPIPGLYQTGGSTHPGGSITGAPGRNAAMVLLADLGHDPAEVLAAPARAGAAAS